MLFEFWMEISKYKDVAVVLAPLFAVAGALLVNEGNTVRQRKQLENDRTEKAKDRTVGRRREIYAEVMGHLATASFQIASPTKSKEEGASEATTLIAQGIETRTLLAKLALLAEPRTARLAALLNKELADFTIRTAAAKRPIWEKEAAIQMASDSVTHRQQKGDELVEELGEAIKKGTVSPEQSTRIQTGITYWTEQRAIAQKEWVHLSMERQSLWEAFAKSVHEGAKPVEYLSRELRLSMRKDLELSDDPATDKLVEQEWKAARAALEAERLKSAQTTGPIAPNSAADVLAPTFIPTAPFPTEQGSGETAGADEKKTAS